MYFFHHINVVKAFKARLGIPYVFQIADGIFLTVHIVRQVSVFRQGTVGILHTPDGFQTVTVKHTVRFEIRGFFDTEGMYGYVFRLQRQNGVDSGTKGLCRIGGQTGDQVDVDGFQSHAACGLVSFKELSRRVLSADSGEHIFVQSLGIYADSVHAVADCRFQLFPGDVSGDKGTYSGDKFGALQEFGFRYYLGFCTDGNPWAVVEKTYVRMGRIMVTGSNLAYHKDWFTDLFDPASVLDASRGTIPQ